jgi:hypothetical protein
MLVRNCYREGVLITYKGVGLEVNADKNESHVYIAASQQNVGQIKIQ